MKVSCLVSLALLAAFTFGYYQWLGQTFEGKELWIGSFVAGLIALFGLGAIYSSFLAWRDASVLSDAIVDMPRRDGKRTAAAGTLEPLGQPLIAPLSGKECVLYEYDIAREVTTTKKGGGTQTSRAVDFAGIGKTECVVRSTSSRLRLIGFPDLDSIAEEHFEKDEDRDRAWQYVKFAPLEDASGFSVLHGARDMFRALTGSEDALRKDWRMIAVRNCPWLVPPPKTMTEPVSLAELSAAIQNEGRSPARVGDESIAMEQQQDLADDEFDAEDFSDDDFLEDEDDEEEEDEIRAYLFSLRNYRPTLSEKRLEPGKEVVVIGRYDEVRQGLVGGTSQTLKIYADDLTTVAGRLSRAKWSYLFGGLITLLLVNGVVWGTQQVYRQSDTAQRKWREQLDQAIRDNDLSAIEALQRRTGDLKTLLNSGGQPVLFAAGDPAMARLLIERGADVNATDEDGTTPLMQAVRKANPALVQVLIDAKADLDARNTNYHTTALMDAEGQCEECAELLRKAGAGDDRITAQNGEPMDESHPAFATVRDYLAAVFAADPARLRELSTPQLGEHFSGVDFPLWQESRPTAPRLVSGFVAGDKATLTVIGPNPGGADRTWVYQLHRSGQKWLVSRERWVTQ